jgi:hypothetical protein
MEVIKGQSDEVEVTILERAKQFFRTQIVQSHIEGGIDRASRLDNYNIHPFLYKYLANFLEGNSNPRSIAKALIYPRILGTSITTIFGTHAQRMINELFAGMGSAIPGIDIEFMDGINKRKKYCQLKSGPNNINKGDIKTIIDGFQGIRNLAKTNNLPLQVDDLVVGVLYGTPEDLSNHFVKVSEYYPVYVGSDFWYHLTGEKDFYIKLIGAIGEVALEVDGRERLEAAITALARDVEDSF